MSQSERKIDLARSAVDQFLSGELSIPVSGLPEVTVLPDGPDNWAFFILEDDTTSYVHTDLSVEWYGTSWKDRGNEASTHDRPLTAALHQGE